jgi:hydrophobe/amphiphile efflux-3 (HAE3) family protein
MTPLIERFVEAWARACLTYRKTILVALAAYTALTVSRLPDLQFNNALSTWFVDGDPALVAHQRFRETFGSDEIVVIGLEAADVFAPETLERIGRVTRAVEQAPHVEKVFSITNIESITGRGDVLEIGDLVEFPLDPAKLPLVRARALANQLYVGNVVSADGKFAAIIARLPHDPGGFDYKVAAVRAIRRIAEAEVGDDFYLAGGPVFDEQFFRQSEIDTLRTVALMSVLLAVVLTMLMRSVWGVVLPLVTVGLATAWTIGSMGLLGMRVNVITTILPPLLLAVGVADAMHLLVDYQNRCRGENDKLSALRDVYHELLGPLFLTALTTAIGMLSLSFSRIQAIRDFGWFAAYGVASAFLLTVTFVPIVLSYLPPPRPAPDRRRKQYLSTRALTALHDFTMTHGRAIVVGWGAVIALAIVFALQVRAESSFIRIFKESSRIRQDTDHIQQRLAGSGTVEITVDTGVAGGVKDPEALRALERLERFLESQAHVRSTQSIVDYFKDMRRAFHGNDQREYSLPQTREEAAQYLLLYDLDAPDGDIHNYVTLDESKARVSARVDLTTSNDAVALAREVERYITEEFPPGLETSVTGLMVVYANLEEYIRESLVRGFGSALISIFIVFCFQMRSIKLGAVVMFANTMPILITLGVMGLTGIRLDSMSVMVASIAIGLADDDSIHFVSRVRSKVSAGLDIVVALRESLVEVGRALVYSALALCGGFAVMLTAGFVGAIYFGLLTMLTILIALVADLVLLPVMLRRYGPAAR